MNLFTKVGVIMLLLSILMSGGGLVLLVSGKVYVLEFSLFDFVGVEVGYEMMVDYLSFLYSGVVLFISGAVSLYSNYYMSGDKNQIRFVGLMVLFVMSSILMVTSGGFISLMLGWDGLGVISYCLVIYYQSSYSHRAGMITIFTNRLGDVFLLLVIGLLLGSGSWSYLMVNKLGWMVLILLILAAMTKSAQFPFCAWLPEAMAAPTPVSSLVHSSTLVTAGVYLMVRMYWIMTYVGNILLLVGLITMMMAGISALYELDMKKVVALSTLSQLGFMMVTLGMGNWFLGYFHMIMHAFFKAMMFLSVGGLIHMGRGAQDCRYNMSLGVMLPMVGQGMVVSVVCLGGMPFLGAFFSKDLILEMMLSGGCGLIYMLCYMLGVCLSIVYGVRLLVLGMVMKQGGMSVMNFHGNNYLKLGIGLLMFMSITSGAMVMWLTEVNDVILFPCLLKMTGLMFLVVGGLFMLCLMGFMWMKQSVSTYVPMFFGGMWNMKELSYVVVLGIPLKLGYYKDSEVWGEELGGEGLSKVVLGLVSFFQVIQSKFMLMIVVMFMMGLNYSLVYFN